MPLHIQLITRSAYLYSPYPVVEEDKDLLVSVFKLGRAHMYESMTWCVYQSGVRIQHESDEQYCSFLSNGGSGVCMYCMYVYCM